MRFRAAALCGAVFLAAGLLGAGPAQAQSLTVTNATITGSVINGTILTTSIGEFQTFQRNFDFTANKDVTWEILTGSGSIPGSPTPCTGPCEYDSADAGLFRLSTNTARVARVEFRTAPDYETVTSAAGDHSFKVALKATAGTESITFNIVFPSRTARSGPSGTATATRCRYRTGASR